MKILFDGYIYNVQKEGGISRYFTNIIERLPDDCQPTVLVKKQNDRNYPKHQNINIIDSMPYRHGPYRLSNKVNRILRRNEISGKAYDIAHPTYYELSIETPISNYSCPVVVTVYDLIHEIYPKWLDQHGYHAQHVSDALQRADAIICISNATRLELIKYYPFVEKKCNVIHLAGTLSLPSKIDHNQISDPYILYVGGRASYKNFARLLKAYSYVKEQWKDLKLYIVGPQFNDTEYGYLDSEAVSDSIIHMGNVNDNTLASLYYSATAFVYPSLYEGFGIPPLEAMSCGGLVLASNTSSIPEVVGEAAILFDPKSIDNMVETILSLKDMSDATRAHYIQKGKERALMFSWERTAEHTLDIYRQIASCGTR